MLNIFDEAIQALKRGEPAQLRLPNGTVISGVPSIVSHPETNEPIVEFHIHSDGDLGPIEMVARMSLDTYEKMVLKAERMSPRLAMVQRNLLSRGGDGT